MNLPLSFGSVCSGIEAARVAFDPLGIEQLWSSEIAAFPCSVLEHHYRHTPNAGDMVDLPDLVRERTLIAPDLFCGGTPCQSFSLAGFKNGLADERGMLTMKFIEIADSIDDCRADDDLGPAVVLWENVEGVLNDKTNAFGNFLAGLAGFSEQIVVPKWTKAGFLMGPRRNVAWRILDAKYFGLPQQRRRLYVVAGGTTYRPDKVLFESVAVNCGVRRSALYSEAACSQVTVPLFGSTDLDSGGPEYLSSDRIRLFRSYTDCLYAAYGTKWNGNAAAYNGSLYVAHDGRVRRLTPLECERLMGLPDDYTKVPGCTDTSRYRAIGNSWAVPVINWIGSNILGLSKEAAESDSGFREYHSTSRNSLGADLYLFNGNVRIDDENVLNTSDCPSYPYAGDLMKILEVDNVPEKYFLSVAASSGILRRRKERGLSMNPMLESMLAKA